MEVDRHWCGRWCRLHSVGHNAWRYQETVVTPATFAEAEKLMQVTMTPAERQQAADSWRQSLAPYLERRTGPRKVAIAHYGPTTSKQAVRHLCRSKAKIAGVDPI